MTRSLIGGLRWFDPENEFRVTFDCWLAVVGVTGEFSPLRQVPRPFDVAQDALCGARGESSVLETTFGR